jgi:antibiotic biosynthesis monooxygenase (ABM) superfamily enzyme
LTSTGPVTPPRHRLAVATWLAIYPTITLVVPGLEAFGVNDLALPLRTLAINLVVVPAVVFVVTPALTRLLGDGCTVRRLRRMT